MHIIRGKQTSVIDTFTFADLLRDYRSVHIDVGTGDGRFVQHAAATQPDSFVIGIDACRENLHAVSRRAPVNALFVIANAEMLPPEIDGLAANISVNFPWGSLLAGLLAHESAVVGGLRTIARPDARLNVRLNAGALAEQGWPLDAGADQVRAALAAGGFVTQPPAALTTRDLRDFPTTWARRLAFGRDPRALCLTAVWP